MKRGIPEFVRARFDPAGLYGLRLTLLTIAVLIFALPFGFLMRAINQTGWLLEVDTLAANELHEAVVTRSWAVTILQAVSFMGSPLWFWLIVGAAVIYLLRVARHRLAIYLVATTLIGGLVDTIVKIAVARPRPSLEDPVATAHGQSFPSGHSMSSFIAYGALLLCFMPVIPKQRRKWAITAAAAIVALIGFSRLALGVHYITDVLGGYVLGAAWLIASTAAFEIWREELGRKPVPPIEGLEPEARRDIGAAMHPRSSSG